MSVPGTTIRTQKLMYDEIHWDQNNTLIQAGPLVPSENSTFSGHMPQDYFRDPGMLGYWTFFYRLDSNKGLILSNIIAYDTQRTSRVHPGGHEEVFSDIDFTDIKVYFTDGLSESFNINRAFNNSLSEFKTSRTGTRTTVQPNDHFFQRGLKLVLVDNVLADSGGVCNLEVCMSVVFRGARADFDPGSIPVAMLIYPQISLKYSSVGLTKRVAKIRSSVRITTNNRMYSAHPAPPAPHRNIASMFTDSNTSMRGNARGNYFTGRSLRNTASIIQGLPIGWSTLFDYVNLNIPTEKEIIACYGPDDGNFYTNTRPRSERYIWPNILDGNGVQSQIDVAKEPRQGMYDNMHIHALMMNRDRCNNIQVHAPFCGHSCVHLHWRWSSIASNGSESGPGWRYKGWGPEGAYSLDNAPLIPPNQHVKIALCHRNTSRHSEAHIINLANPSVLHPLYKKIWYQADVIRPNAGEAQVIMDHGLGWAYKYNGVAPALGTPGLPPLIFGDSLPWWLLELPPTQQDWANFFETDVYPFFRYINQPGVNCKNQVPSGDYNTTFNGNNGASMEEL